MHLGNANEVYTILHSELMVTAKEIHVGSSIKSSLKALARCATEAKDNDNGNSAVNSLSKVGVFFRLRKIKLVYLSKMREFI